MIGVPELQKNREMESTFDNGWATTRFARFWVVRI